MAPIVPLIGWGAAALGGLTLGGTRALKDELGLGDYDAAQHELMQPSQKGYNTKTGKTQVGLVEGFNDWWLGRDRANIDRLAQEGHIENLKSTQAGLKVLRDRPDFDFNARTTEEDVNKKLAEIERRDPLISQIYATGQVKGKYTREQLQGMDQDSLQGILTNLSEEHEVHRIKTAHGLEENSPGMRRADQRHSDQMMITMQQLANSNADRRDQFAIQMAQQNYNNRRLDMQEQRAERKDRQAMIMMLMKGLAQMGQGIAI